METFYPVWELHKNLRRVEPCPVGAFTFLGEAVLVVVARI